jgi:hypothetical protein
MDNRTVDASDCASHSEEKGGIWTLTQGIISSRSRDVGGERPPAIDELVVDELYYA